MDDARESLAAHSQEQLGCRSNGLKNEMKIRAGQARSGGFTAGVRLLMANKLHVRPSFGIAQSNHKLANHQARRCQSTTNSKRKDSWHLQAGSARFMIGSSQQIISDLSKNSERSPS
jgi:hypothetical protein